MPEPGNCEIEIFYVKVISYSSRNYPSSGLIPVTEMRTEQLEECIGPVKEET